MGDDAREESGWPIAVALERLARLLRAGDHGAGLNPAQSEALRFIARANRFSDSPAALASYLGATKGTISQTLKALERKGLVVKELRPGGRRSLRLILTAEGENRLAADPWMKLAGATANLGGKTRRRLAKGLEELLVGEIAAGGHASFGNCTNCRFFREKGSDHDPEGPHRCMLFEAPLAVSECGRLCVGFGPRD